MKHARNISILLMSVLFVTPAAVGMDLNPPPWDLSLPNQTWQAWEFTLDAGPFPTEYQNSYGEPFLENYQATWPDPVEGPDGTIIDTLHIDEPGGLTIYIENNPEPLPVKWIYWQITSDKSPTPTGTGPTTTTPSGQTGTNLPAPYPQIQHPNGTWYTYNGLIEIRPNPEAEWITFDFVPSTNIEEIVIYTVCTIPEPTTMALLGLGSLALLRRR